MKISENNEKILKIVQTKNEPKVVTFTGCSTFFLVFLTTLVPFFIQVIHLEGWFLVLFFVWFSLINLFLARVRSLFILFWLTILPFFYTSQLTFDGLTKIIFFIWYGMLAWHLYSILKGKKNDLILHQFIIDLENSVIHLQQIPKNYETDEDKEIIKSIIPIEDIEFFYFVYHKHEEPIDWDISPSTMIEFFWGNHSWENQYFSHYFALEGLRSFQEVEQLAFDIAKKLDLTFYDNIEDDDFQKSLLFYREGLENKIEHFISLFQNHSQFSFQFNILSRTSLDDEENEEEDDFSNHE